MYKVLVVEDEKLEREAIGQILFDNYGEASLTIDFAVAGDEAYEKIQKNPPDLVFLDIHIPGISGFDLIKRLNKSLEIEIIIITAYSYFEYAREALTLGVRDYLVKPLKLETFLHTVDATLNILEEKRRAKDFLEQIVTDYTKPFEKGISHEYLLNEAFIKFSELSLSGSLPDAANYLISNLNSLTNSNDGHDSQKLLYVLTMFFKSLNLPHNQFLKSFDLSALADDQKIETIDHKMMEMLIIDFLKNINTLVLKESNHEEKNSIIYAINEFLEDNYSGNINLEHLGSHVNRNPAYVSRLYKAETGINLKDKLKSIRIEAAKKMLEQGGCSIKEVAFCAGFSDPNYFSLVFKKETGVSASDYLLFYG